MSVESSLTAPKGVRPRVVTFFALYPEALGLTDQVTHYVVMSATPVRGFSTRVALHLKEGESPIFLAPQLSAALVVSVRFHRGRRVQNLFSEYDAMLMAIVNAVTGSSFPEFDRLLSADTAGSNAAPKKGNNPSLSSYTVVEMTTQVVRSRGSSWEACQPSHEVMGPTLTRCINGLIRVINAYRFAEKIQIPTPVRERIGPIIVAATRPADPDKGNWDEPAHYVLNAFATARTPSLRGGEGPAVFQAMDNYLQAEAMGHPSISTYELEAELSTAFHYEGNFRAAVMFAHSASEVLLDAALLAMLYEECRPIEYALSVFEKPLKTRVLTEYHERLGGPWTPKGKKAVADWLQNLLVLRHRVAHTGYLFSYEEAFAAGEAYHTLAKQLRNRLAAQAKKYPFAAGLLVTSGGFERRGIRSKAATSAIKTNTPEAVKKFIEWRTEFIRRRS